MNKVNSTLGSYLPFFFHMEVSFPFPSRIHPMERLDERFLSIYIHEYIHFLQDITTYSGLNNGYVYSEYIHGVVTDIYDKKQNEVIVPYRLPDNCHNIHLNKYINKESFGSCTDRETVIINRIVKKRIKIPFANPYLKYHTKILIETIPKGNGSLEFGRLALMESMAYIIEKKITLNSPSAPDFPYNAAKIVSEKIYPEFSYNEENILALCDMCLQFSEPGKVFVSTLEDYKNKRFIPSKAEEIIDNFYSKPCDSILGERSLLNSYLYFSLQVGERLKTYLNDSQFKAFHNVIHKLIGFGMNVRCHDRYYFLNIYRGGYALNNLVLMETNRQIGTPVIIDNNKDYWVVYPLGYNGDNFPIEYFAAIEELFKLFDEGSTACNMYEWCSKSPHTKVDDRCVFSPGSRTTDKYLCPYAVLLKHWKLSDKTFVKKRS